MLALQKILLSVIGSSHSAVIVVVTGLHIGPIDSLVRNTSLGI